MNKRDQLNNTLARLNELQNQAAECHQKMFDIEAEQQKLVSTIILEERLFEGTRWMLGTGIFASQLDYSCDTHPNIQAIDELIAQIYLSDFELEPGITLSVSEDDEIRYLQFDDSKKMANFVQKNNLIVDGTEVTKRFHQLKREIAALEVILHLLNLK